MERLYELTPNPNSGVKSFYGKAFVKRDKDGTETLISYGLSVCRRYWDGHIVRLWDGWSATTGRHIAAFCGISKTEYMNLDFESEE